MSSRRDRRSFVVVVLYVKDVERCDSIRIRACGTLKIPKPFPSEDLHEVPTPGTRRCASLPCASYPPEALVRSRTAPQPRPSQDPLSRADLDHARRVVSTSLGSLGQRARRNYKKNVLAGAREDVSRTDVSFGYERAQALSPRRPRHARRGRSRRSSRTSRLFAPRLSARLARSRGRPCRARQPRAPFLPRPSPPDAFAPRETCASPPCAADP